MASNKTHINGKHELVTLDVRIDDEDDKNFPEEEEEDDENGGARYISSQLCLKLDEQNKVDKEVILRRIRHRRRVNKVKSAVQALFSSPFSTTATTSLNHKFSVQPPPKWLDDNFAAP